MNKIKLLPVLILIFILISAIVFVSIKSSSQGARLVKVEQQIKILEEKNKILKNEMVTESSLLYLNKVASAFDFNIPSEIVYLGPIADSLNSGLAYANKTQNH